MDLLLSDFENAMRIMGTSPWQEIDKKNQIQDRFISLRDQIPTEAWPKDVSRFVENVYSLIELLQKHERWKSRVKDDDIYLPALAKIEEYVTAQPLDMFPRSISLFQLVLGIPTAIYKFPAEMDVWFPISSELELLFPHVIAISNRFAFV